MMKIQIVQNFCISTPLFLSPLFQTVAIISIVFIIISTMVLTLNTLPYFSGAGENSDHEEDFPPFALLEAVYMSWFTFEFLVGLKQVPNNHEYHMDGVTLKVEQEHHDKK